MKRQKLLSLVMSLSLTLVLLVGVTPAAFAARAVMGDSLLSATQQTTDDYCPATQGAHSWDGREVLLEEATCTEEALYSVHCGRCGYTTTLTTPALGHDWSEWDVIEEATCTEPGILVRECDRCGEEETAYLPALDHDFILTEVIQEATCTEAGIQRYTCSRCGTTLDEVTPLAPHSFGEWYVLTEATDWSAGTQEHTCTVCGTKEQAEYYLDGTLFLWDEGDAVAAFQVLLNENGFDCGEADGSFGPNTQAATEAAEEASGHDPTGIGWTGLQAWLAGDTQEPDSDDFGLTTSSDEAQPLESAADLFSKLRLRWPQNAKENSLTIAVQPEGGQLSNVLGYYKCSITMADGTGSMKYWLYRDGEIYGGFTEKDGDDPDRLYCEWQARNPGEYYFHVEDSTGRWVDSDPFTVTTPWYTYDEPLVISEQPKGGVLSKVTGKYTLCITIANSKPSVVNWLTFDLYKDGELYASYETPEDDPDPLHHEIAVDQPGEYYFYVKEFAGRRALSDTVTVTKQESSEPSADTMRWPQNNADGGLTIAVQPVGGTIGLKPSYMKFSITMADGTGSMKYWLYKDGKLDREVIAKNSDDPDRLYCDFTVFYPGEYYIHVEDSTGRWADSDPITVMITGYSFEEPLIITEQPKGGVLSVNAGKYQYTLSITVANTTPSTFNSLAFTLYKDNEYYTHYTSTGEGSDPLHCEITVDQPGEYYFFVREFVGRRALSDTVTVTTPKFSAPSGTAKPHTDNQDGELLGSRLVKQLDVTQQPSGGIIPKDGSSRNTYAITVQIEGGFAPYTYEWRRKTDWASAQRDYAHELLGTIDPSSFSEQFTAQASSIKSHMQQAAGYREPGRTLQEYLVENSLESRIQDALLKMASTVVATVNSSEHTSAYFVATPGDYFCIITDSKGNQVVTDTATVSYGLTIAGRS